MGTIQDIIKKGEQEKFNPERDIKLYAGDLQQPGTMTAKSNLALAEASIKIENNIELAAAEALKKSDREFREKHPEIDVVSKNRTPDIQEIKEFRSNHASELAEKGFTKRTLLALKKYLTKDAVADEVTGKHTHKLNLSRQKKETQQITR